MAKLLIETYLPQSIEVNKCKMVKITIKNDIKNRQLTAVATSCSVMNNTYCLGRIS